MNFPDFLKSHPFAVEAYFRRSLVLTYAIPVSDLKNYIPESLTPDTYNDQWAFIAIALVQTQGLRPKGLPQIFGNDFFLAGYRIFVRYRTSNGKNLRGLYILRSETDRNKMVYYGNIFTHYNYFQTDITLKEDNDLISISSENSDIDIIVDTSNSEIDLPENSPFKDWKEARRFAGPLPFTFTYNKTSRTMLIIEGVRQNWKPSPVKVLKHHVGFLKTLNVSDVRLANAFMVKDIPYYWKKGRKDKWIK